ncbi:MAG: septum formation initiator family protein [Syntrophales bacterium]|nr:septum formation initiator family protein [Syntrophales bacterium]
MKVGRYLVVFVLVMGFLITFGDRGLVDNYSLRKKILEMKSLNYRIYCDNKELGKTITLLRSDLSYIETVARNELGMVRKGDIVYRYTK